ncbi:MAG: hypothetical protein ACKOBJ_01140, partial [Actinomycetota bacterium]
MSQHPDEEFESEGVRISDKRRIDPDTFEVREVRQPEAPAGEPAPAAVVLASADPANPYGAALPWPARPDADGGGHRPGRKAGALVVLVDGALVWYLE